MRWISCAQSREDAHPETDHRGECLYGENPSRQGMLPRYGRDIGLRDHRRVAERYMRRGLSGRLVLLDEKRPDGASFTIRYRIVLRSLAKPSDAGISGRGSSSACLILARMMASRAFSSR